ncbi:MmgE/PrpD family protein [Natranaerofaba carboxydovora]|uniref:MmgE/PrpD family protein n=1 Tax=Natranaerofaba carboxydovora TaxID=2742683 RepID=UPI001F147E6F|nr:MmgE/PrpD family protein [Natranaerofaba carboxydovora]UMZ74179.1 2-methylcitrate dehydratase 2 [Natranaerofaba carboxydovora]
MEYSEYNDIEKKLADFVVSLNYEDIPVEVNDSIKRLLIDYAGLSYKGAEMESSKPVLQMLAKLDGFKEIDEENGSVVAGTEFKARYEYSCLANGIFSHSLELDDVVNEASIHPGVVVFPAAISAAEETGANGKDFITAVVAGYEVMIRLGRAVNPTAHYKCGFHPTGTTGTFAAAVTVGKLMGLSSDELISAFGISTSQAASSLEFLNDGTWTKRFHPGWSAHSGYIGAKLASCGFKGPMRGIEGKYGFLNSYSDDSKPELSVENLGSEFLTLNTSIKPHACCRYNQSPIDATLDLVKNNDITADQVEEVNVKLVGPGMQLVGEPWEKKQNPENVVDAQFSLPYAVSIAILKKRAFLDEYNEEVINSIEVKDLMKKVSCSRDSNLETEFPKKWPCEVEIKTVDGRVFNSKIEHPKGDPENPLCDDELILKFKSLADKMTQDQQEKFIEEVYSLENIQDINELSAYLSLSS